MEEGEGRGEREEKREGRMDGLKGGERRERRVGSLATICVSLIIETHTHTHD